MKKILLPILAFVFLLLSAGPITAAEKTTIYFFWGDGCPHCETQKSFLDNMQKKYPGLEIKSFETWKNKENKEILNKLAAAYGTQVRGVPVTFIGDFAPLIGFADYMADDMEKKISVCLEEKCPDPGIKAGLAKPEEPAPPKQEESQKEEPRPDPEPSFDPKPDFILIVSEAENKTDQTAKEEESLEPAVLSDLCLHFFSRPSCPQCREVEDFLSDLKDKYEINIRQYNIAEPADKELFDLFKKKYELLQPPHPIIFIGSSYFIGDRAILENIEKEIIKCQSEPCVCPLANVKAVSPYMPKRDDFTPEETGKINLPLVGEVDFSVMPIYVSTAVIAFVDGFNPCSLWLIFFLLGIVVYSGSKKKILLVGAIFLLVTGAAYALFMAGLLNVFLYIGYLKWIQISVALMALLFALVNIKDYFWYKKGLSFTISDKHKPTIFKRVRHIMKEGKSTWGIIVGTAVLALGVVLVELPCTMGLPVIWANLLAQAGIHGSEFYWLLLLYMLIYLFDEILIIAVVFFTMKVGRFEEKHGRIIKLEGGMIMLALGLVMLFKPDLMHSIGGSLIPFGLSIAATLLTLFIHRVILPKLGFKIGSEENLGKPENRQEEKREEKGWQNNNKNDII